MTNLVSAILSVMGEVENIEKNLTVGEGKSAYKGVSDKDVKLAIGKAMRKHGLVILPLKVNPTVKIDRWEEDTYYNGQKTSVKTKQSVFTEVEPEYLLLHSSGESQIIAGYGHGVDSQDKSAGKATTYALKNVLLNLFLVPTGTVDDTDNKHSDDLPVPGDKASENQSEKVNAVKATTIAPSLVKVINKTSDLVALNTIWNNNKQLHENVEFLKIISMRRIDIATSKEDLTKIFDDAQLLHTDTDFVSQLGVKKKEFLNDNTKKQTA